MNLTFEEYKNKYKSVIDKNERSVESLCAEKQVWLRGVYERITAAEEAAVSRARAHQDERLNALSDIKTRADELIKGADPIYEKHVKTHIKKGNQITKRQDPIDELLSELPRLIELYYKRFMPNQLLYAVTFRRWKKTESVYLYQAYQNLLQKIGAEEIKASMDYNAKCREVKKTACDKRVAADNECRTAIKSALREKTDELVKILTEE